MSVTESESGRQAFDVAGRSGVVGAMPTADCQWLGRVPYRVMWQRMQERAAQVANGEAAEAVWACEHEPVYTTGRRRIDNRLQATLPAPLVEVDRGGETTFHGPGQLLLYPVIHLRSRSLGVRAYVGLLEGSCIAMLQQLGLNAGRNDGFPGVWVDGVKIAAVGVRVCNGVAYHGMALNLDVEPHWFRAISPCGLSRQPGCAADYIVLPEISLLAGRWCDSLTALLRANPVR